MQSARLLTGLMLGAVVLWGAGPAMAQQAQRPTTMVVPFVPGGATDLLARLTASNLSSQAGQNVIVENRSGAGGYVGSEYVSRAAADGSALLFTAQGTLHSHLFVKGQSTVLSRALVPIAGIGEAPFVLVAPTNLPTKSLGEFLAYVKASPTKLNVAIVTGGAQLLDTVTFLRRAGLDMVMIPYNDGQGPLLSLVRGENQFYIGTLTVSKPHLESKRIVALAVSGAARFSLAAEIPTVKEQGVNFVAGVYYAVFGPAKMSPELVAQLNKRILSSMDNRAAREGLSKIGFDPVPGTPEELAVRFAKELTDLTEAAAIAGIQPQ